MKEIKAIIPPQRLPKIRSAMRNLKNFPGMTVTKVDGCGHGLKKVTDDLRQELTDYTPKVLIQMITPDNLVEGILQIIVETAHTGQQGDGLVWVTPIERMIRLSEKIIVDES
jgi:nitrogen regulatory protein P-II 1